MKICQTTISFLCVILFNSCFPIKTVEDSFEINDLSKKQEFSVSIDLQDNQFVYKASLKIKGNSDGEFKINDLFVEPGEIDTLISIESFNTGQGLSGGFTGTNFNDVMPQHSSRYLNLPSN